MNTAINKSSHAALNVFLLFLQRQPVEMFHTEMTLWLDTL